MTKDEFDVGDLVREVLWGGYGIIESIQDDTFKYRNVVYVLTRIMPESIGFEDKELVLVIKRYHLFKEELERA